MKFPVPAVRLIVPDDRGRVLILRRSATRYGKGDWCLPGGKVDYGATVEQTVIQELAEETSLFCIASEFLFYQDSLPLTSGDMHCINLYFECSASGEIRLNRESDRFRWITADEMTDYRLVFRNDEALIKYWQNRILRT